MTKFTSYDVVGTKEDVSDVISNIAPTDTPFTSSIGSETVKNKLFEWQEDDLASVTVNAAVEGADAVTQTLTPTVMRDNVTQIFTKSFSVTGTNDAEDKYGRAKETAYQMVKKGKEIKRDLEHALVGMDQAKVTGSNTVARQTASAFKQIAAATTVDASGGTGTPTAMTEGMLLDLGQELYKQGAEPTTFMVKPEDALIVAAFDRAAGRYREINGEGKKIVNAVDLYVSPFGSYKVVINRFIKSTNALLFDAKMWSLAWLRKWTREKLAKTGDADKHMILGEVGLKHKNQLASGTIMNLA